MFPLATPSSEVADPKHPQLINLENNMFPSTSHPPITPSGNPATTCPGRAPAAPSRSIVA
jgi:hypothetical protein